MYQNKTVILLRKSPRIINYWLLLLVFIFVSFLSLFLVKFKIKLYYPGFITKIGNQYYVKFYSKDTEVGKLNRKEVYINGKKYPLAYTKIKEAYTITESLENVHEVHLKLDLPKNLCIENLRVELLFETRKTTLLDLFLKRFKQGVYETIR